MKQIKPPKTIDEQIELLCERGLRIDDTGVARDILSKVSYYRLINAYSLGLYDCAPGIPPKTRYIPGVSLSQIYDIYQFDTKVRHIVFELIEHFEVQFRMRLAHCIAHSYCAMAYLQKDIYQEENYYESFLSDLSRERTSQQKSVMLQHHNKNYNGNLPVWAMVEIVSFGTLSKLFRNLNKDAQKEISKEYGVDPSYLISWLNAFVVVRNACAHYGRLYNWRNPSPPRLFTDLKGVANNRIFAVIYLLMKNTDDPILKHSAYIRLKAAVAAHPSINLFLIGFPTDWNDKLRLQVGLPPEDNLV